MNTLAIVPELTAGHSKTTQRPVLFTTVDLVNGDDATKNGEIGLICMNIKATTVHFDQMRFENRFLLVNLLY